MPLLIQDNNVGDYIHCLIIKGQKKIVGDYDEKILTKFRIYVEIFYFDDMYICGIDL